MNIGKTAMNRIVELLAIALACTSLYAASLEENVTAIEKARVDIEAAIRAKGGMVRGGLVNAAGDIVNIPDSLDFEKTYVAWSNAVKGVFVVTTNDTLLC